MRIEAPESSQRERAKLRTSSGALRCRRKFLRFFPRGFQDEDYLETERDYKWESHLRWREVLGADEIAALLRAERYSEIASSASSRSPAVHGHEAEHDARRPA